METTAIKNLANTLNDSIKIIGNNGLLRDAKSNLKKYELELAVSADILDEIKNLDNVRTKLDFSARCNELREKLVSMINQAEMPINDPEPKKPVVVNLYHGTNADFENFENDFICTENSIDQYGSGFYFYNEENSSKTSLHGGIQIKVRAWLENPIKHDDNNLELTSDQIHSMICSSPNFEDRLWDHGDIDFEGFDNVLENAVNVYLGFHWLDALNAIGNDFFNGVDTHILLSLFCHETGHNCIIDDERGIVVMLKKSDFEITERKFDND